KGVPVVLLSMTGSAMDLSVADKDANAILQVWYPGAGGGKEIGEILNGKTDPSGKLPVTVYKATSDLPEFTDYSMKGRTYRYIETTPLYPFGYGLTYSDIRLTEASIVSGDSFSKASEEGMVIKVKAENFSDIKGAQVVQVYVKNGDSNETLHPHLAAFERINVDPKATSQIEIKVPAKAFTTVDDEGVRAVRGSSAKVFVGCGQPDERTKELLDLKIFEFDI
ncbi:MAG: glycoside hydrolase family 3 C-terminal domain-containing protein, partial [Clostridiales bacterium]|nr:glycoside hydrolase family 3 C-terminal domain-containing protein [Clostridiales bacterium]